jgi:hypothetical protein
MGEGLDPHIISIKRNEYNNILITTDGVHNAPPEALRQVVAASQKNADLVRKLITLSDTLGGRDNATSIGMSTYFKEISHDQGANLAFLSPCSSLEIWYPRATRTELPSSGLKELSEVGTKADTDPKISDRRPKPQGGGRRGKKKRAQANPGLPPDARETPPLQVEFPKKQGN